MQDLKTNEARLQELNNIADKLTAMGKTEAADKIREQIAVSWKMSDFTRLSWKLSNFTCSLCENIIHSADKMATQTEIVPVLKASLV